MNNDPIADSLGLTPINTMPLSIPVVTTYGDKQVDDDFEYDEDGNLSTPEFSSHYFYENNYGWYETSEGDLIIKISNYVSKCLRIVGLEDLKISTYINCEK